MSVRPAWLLLGVFGYLGWLAWHADVELNAEYRVEGLFRTYLPPQDTAEHYVIDVRPGSLFEEVLARFKPGAEGSPPAKETPEAWASALARAGLPAEVRAGRTETSPPRIEWTARGPVLVLGTFNRQPLLFDPAVGTVLSKGAPLGQQNRAVYLIDAREVPW